MSIQARTLADAALYLNGFSDLDDRRDAGNVECGKLAVAGEVTRRYFRWLAAVIPCGGFVQGLFPPQLVVRGSDDQIEKRFERIPVPQNVHVWGVLCWIPGDTVVGQAANLKRPGQIGGGVQTEVCAGPQFVRFVEVVDFRDDSTPCGRREGNVGLPLGRYILHAHGLKDDERGEQERPRFSEEGRPVQRCLKRVRRQVIDFLKALVCGCVEHVRNLVIRHFFTPM